MTLSPEETWQVMQEADAGAVDALAVVLRASRPGRFRLLTVHCTANHTLVTVYATKAGSVYTATSGLETNARYRSRARTFVGTLGALDAVSAAGGDIARLSVPAACRCRSPRIPLVWLRDRLADTPSRRVMWPPREAQ